MIKEFRAVLADEQKVKDIIKDEMLEIRRRIEEAAGE